MVIKVLRLFAAVSAVTIEHKQASSFLRTKRSNQGNWFFEELKEGNLQRECYEEVCSYAEAMEAIENVPSMIAFWNIHKRPCETLRLCGDSECQDQPNGRFQCQCNSGLRGELCHIDCSKKNDPTSLTSYLSDDAFTTTGYTEHFGPDRARWIPSQSSADIFVVNSGGFPNVWKSSDTENSSGHTLTIDLGQARTVTKIRIRGGHHGGTVCTPDQIELRVGKTKTSISTKENELLIVEQSDTIQPQEIEVQPIFGRFVQLKPIVNRMANLPPCFAVDIIGKGGKKLPTDLC